MACSRIPGHVLSATLTVLCLWAFTRTRGVQVGASVQVRLVDGTNPHEGRVEVYYQDQWGTVCDDNWDIDDANVICRQLGYPPASQAWQNARFGEGSGPITLDEVECDGHESSIEQCNHQEWLTNDCSHEEDAGVTCGDREGVSPSTVQVRLVDGTNPQEGRVEVYYLDQWGTVCDDNWDIDDANVICRQLGYPPASQAWTNAHFGEGTGQIVLDEVKCDGDESSIEQCNHQEWLTNDCSHEEDAGVTCGDREGASPSTVQVRLVDGTNPHEGRVEIYYQDQWGTVCDDLWNIDDANVICRQLGYPSASQAWDRAHFGEGSGPIVLDDVECDGHEASIEQCDHPEWLTNDCDHEEDAGVTCGNEGLGSSTVQVRLVNGTNPYEGRVEVYYQDQWGTVCDDDWDIDDANVICRQLGYPSASQAWDLAHFGEGSGPILLDNVECNGQESSIEYCEHRGWLNQNCGHSEDAGVTCDKDDEDPTITCPASQTVETDSRTNFASVVLPPPDSASDNSGRYEVTIDVDGATYRKGATVILSPAMSPHVARYTITDGSKNSASCSVYITVVDTTPPTLTPGCPDNINRLVNMSIDSIPVSWPRITATDPSSPLLWASSHQPGDMFPVGTVTMVTYTITDQEGNTAYCNFTVTVTGVGLDCPANVTAIASPGSFSAVVSWSLPKVTFHGADREVDFNLGYSPEEGNPDYKSDSRSGSGGGSGSGSRGPDDRDDEDGDDDVLYPSSFDYHSSGSAGAANAATDDDHSMDSDSTDNFADAGVKAVRVYSNYQPGDNFSIGATPVTYQIQGLRIQCHFHVIVKETIPPMFINGCPDNISRKVNINIGSESVSWPEVTATDPSSPVIWVSSHQPGDVFPAGEVTVVTYKVTDQEGNSASCNFTVAVTGVDLVCPANITAVADPDSSSADVSWALPDVIFDGVHHQVMFFLGDPPKEGTSESDGPVVRVYSNHQSGDNFNIGATPVTYNIRGLEIQCDFHVIVKDSTPPMFINGCPDNISRQVNISISSVSVSWPEVTATDPSSPLLWASSHQPGDMFPAGEVTMVTYKVTDQEGNSAACNFTVAVTGVGLVCPANVTAVANPDSSSADVSWTLPDVILNGVHHQVMFVLGEPPKEGTSESDGPIVRVHSDYQSGDFFNVGATPVTYNIQELGINCDFHVIVKDTTPPIFISGCPGNISRKVNINTGSVSVSWSEVNATDPSSPLIWTSSRQPGDMFPTGEVTMVTYKVTDQEGNSASCNFTVAVTGVNLVCPANVTAVANPDSSSADVSWTPPEVIFNGVHYQVKFLLGEPPKEGTNESDGPIVRVYSDYHLGDTFSVGATPVTYNIQELGINCDFHVIVIDTTPPMFINGCPGDISRQVKISIESVSVSWSEVTATDPSSPLIWTSSRQPGDMFPAGEVTLVTYKVTDQEGNSATCNFTVAVAGVGLVCPANVTAVANPDSSSANVSWTPPDVIFTGVHYQVMFLFGEASKEGTNESDGSVVRVYSEYQSGDTFSVGATPVTYNIQELGIHCGFHVIVKDTTPPMFISGCPGDISRQVNFSIGSVSVLWPEVTSTDPSSPLLWTSSHQPGDMFPTGEVTMVTYKVTDQEGNSASCNFTVAVTGVGLVCPANVTAVANPDSSSANVSWTPPDVIFNGVHHQVVFLLGEPPKEGTNESDGSVVRVYSDYQSGDTFSVGATLVTYNIQGLWIQCDFHVIIVNDKVPPMFISGCPGNISRQVKISTESVSVSWPEVTATDSSSPLTWVSSHQPGAMFPAGEVTMVTYKVTDQEGNSASCNFTVAVTGVGLICPANVTTVTNSGSSSADVSWTPPNVIFNGAHHQVMLYFGNPPEEGTSGSDGPIVRVYCNSQSGDTFSIGAIPVTCNIQGLGIQCDFHVIVKDNEPPRINNCHDDVIFPISSLSSRVPYSWSRPVISDNSGYFNVTFGCLATPSTECIDGGGSFAVGVTKVMYDATDKSGNRDVCEFTIAVTVVDIMCPAKVTKLADPGSTRSRVNWPKPHLTGWDGLTNFTSNVSSGDEFKIGTHTVNYWQWFEMHKLALNCSFHVEVKGRCESNTTSDGLTWLVTIAGSTAKSVERCSLMTPNAGEPEAVRNCSILEGPEYFRWENHEPRSCGEAEKEVTLEKVEEVEVSQGNAVEVAEFLANQTSVSSQSTEEVVSNVEVVSNILKNIVAAESGDTEVTEAVLETVNNVIKSTEAKPDTPDDAKTSSAIVQSVEAQVSLTLEKKGNVSIRQDSIHVEAVSLDLAEASQGFSFVSVQQSPGFQPGAGGTLDGTEVQKFANASAIPEDIDVVASIQLPSNIIDLLQSTGNGSVKLQASFIVYADDTLFQSAMIRESKGDNTPRRQVAGSVVSLTVKNANLTNLIEPVVIEFKVPNATQEDLGTILCVSWDFDLENGTGDWSPAGCALAGVNSKVSCECNHATNFAILMDIKGQQPAPDNPSIKRALDIISQVGCALSIVALAVTLIIYLSIRKLRTGISRQIFIHFCFSLLMLYIVFLAGVDNGRGSGGGCVSVAALLHYLTLSTMMWMAVEARNMYVSTVKVFPEDRSKYMLKACLIAWGIPVIVLTITLAAASGHYNNEHYCFLRPDLVLYIGLLTPIGLILIHNIITFVLVMRSLLKVKEVSRSQQISKRLQNAIGISALMGLTWCFGFLAIDAATFAFQLIFCLANSMQGVIVFIMFCVRREEVRTALAPYMKRICCGRECHLPFARYKSYDLEMVSTSAAPTSPSTVQTANLDVSISAAK